MAANTFIVVKQLRTTVAKHLSVLCTHYSFLCKLKELFDGLEPHFEIPLETLGAPGLSTEMMDECSIKI